MKKICIFLTIFLFSIFGFSQINLAVHLKRSYSEDSRVDFIVDTLKIYKDNLLFKKISYPDSFALYEEVQNGQYKFCYKNLFGERVEKIVNLNEKDNILGGQEVNLYIDELQNPKPNRLFIDSLKNGDTLTISLRFSGCFVDGKNSIKIYRKKDHLFLLHNNKKRKLKEKDIFAIVKYETELRNLPEMSFISTLNGYNEISFKGEKFTYDEPSMFWRGYAILEMSLKIKNCW